MAVLTDFDFLQADFNGENGIITKATMIALIGGDADTFSVASQAPAAGTDVRGVAYAFGDWVLTTSGGAVISLAPSAGTDTFAVSSTAAAAGTDAAGNPYAAGDTIVVLANGDVYAMQHVDPSTPGVDTFATAAPATGAGTDADGAPYIAGDVLLTLPSGDVYVLSHPDMPAAACCVGGPICTYDPALIPALSGVCGDANTLTAGAVGDMLLDTAASPVNMFESDGSQWELVPAGTIADLTSFTCDGTGDVWVYYTANGAWVNSGALPAIASMFDPSTWPAPVAPAVINTIISPLGNFMGTTDAKGSHPVANEIGAPLIVGANVTAPVWTGVCGDPNVAPVTADGDYLIDVTSQPINTFIAENGSWDLIPRSTIADLTEFQCTNTPDTYLFDGAVMNWLPGAQPMDTSADDPSTWGAVSFPVRKRCVYNQAGELIGVVDATGGHPIAHPDAATTGAAAPSGAPVPDISGHATPFYVQTPVSNAQSEQTNLNILWWYNGTSWLRINDWVLPTARADLAGIVELATNAETQAGTDATRAVTPASLKFVLDICKTDISAEIDADVAAEAAIRLANDNTEAATRAAADAAEANARAAADAAEVTARNAAIAAAINAHVAALHGAGGGGAAANTARYQNLGGLSSFSLPASPGGGGHWQGQGSVPGGTFFNGGTVTSHSGTGNGVTFAFSGNPGQTLTFGGPTIQGEITYHWHAA